MSIRSVSPPVTERTHFTYVPELHHPPKHIQPAPTYNRILRKQQEMADARSIASLNTEMTDTHSMTETIDDSHHIMVAPVPPPPPPIVPKQHYLSEMQIPPKLEPPIAPVHKPEITSHMVDDVFLRTITEKKTIEDIERHKRLVVLRFLLYLYYNFRFCRLITEFHTRVKPHQAPEPTKWDVTIKNYPTQVEPPEWENFSDISSASGMTLTPKMERAPLSLPPQPQINDNKLPLNAPELVSNIHPNRHQVVTSDLTSRLR